MRLTWHIVKKDLRWLAWAAAGLMAFALAGASWFASRRLPDEVALSGDVSSWMAGVSNLTGVAMSLQFIVGVLLAGVLVLEDKVEGTNAWWTSRPISGARLLTAKLIGAGLLLVAAPTAVLLVVWGASGFTWTESLHAAGRFVVWQSGGPALVALAFAAMAETLARFVFSLCGATLVYVICASRLLSRWLGIEDAVKSGPTVKAIIVALPVIIALTVLLLQFLTRRTRRTWIVVGVGLAMALVVRLAWPSEVGTSEAASVPTEKRHWEIAPKAGAEWRDGAERWRVCAVSEPGQNQSLRIAVEEGGSQFGALSQAEVFPVEYVLVDRRGKEVRFRVERADSAWMDSMWLAAKILELDEAAPGDWAEGKILRRRASGGEQRATTRGADGQ